MWSFRLFQIQKIKVSGFPNKIPYDVLRVLKGKCFHRKQPLRGDDPLNPYHANHPKSHVDQLRSNIRLKTLEALL